ncbi:MAG: carbon-nitrogen hydrolase family protein [Elusimicrobia bacterium HGW-Elusimicrobia-4]|nr:MAG: carbon-nitrogen hydrolase family protein [Elusimicrobia bacterium HGW-Elusimicrobia-4]
MNKKKIVCGIQIQSYPCDIEKNIKKITEWIGLAAKKVRPVLVVFPETVTTGFTPKKPIKNFVAELKREIPKTLKAVAEAARKNKTAVVLPTYEPISDNMLANNAIVFDEKGKIQGRYSKIFPFKEETWTKPGKEVKIFFTGGIKFGVTICYDGDFPALSQKSALLGAELVVRPSALLRSFNIWYIVNRVRAYDNQIFFMGINACGADASGKMYFGHSMIVNPYARIVSEIGINEGFIYTELIPKEKINDHNLVRVNHIADIKKLHPPKIFRI